MLNNKKIIMILIVGLLVLVLIYYNQNIQQSAALNTETNLNLLAAESLEESSSVKDKNTQIVVHLAGAVKNAGVYKLNQSDRLVDLIRAAGGLKENADLEKVNLAEKLYDGQKLSIPKLMDKSNQKNNLMDSDFQTSEGIFSNNFSGSSDGDLININQADQDQLEKLSGIGPSKAAAIIKYREQNSYFSQKNDLLKVSGIGEKTLEKIEAEFVLQ